MSSSPHGRWLGVLPALAALSLSAQEVAPVVPSAAPTAFSYESTLQGYRRFADEPVQSWQAANDAVGRIGGWRSYATEAAQAESPASAAPVPPEVNRPSAPAMGGHGHHHGGRP